MNPTKLALLINDTIDGIEQSRFVVFVLDIDVTDRSQGYKDSYTTNYATDQVGLSGQLHGNSLVLDGLGGNDCGSFGLTFNRNRERIPQCFMAPGRLNCVGLSVHEVLSSVLTRRKRGRTVKFDDRRFLRPKKSSQKDDDGLEQ